jgi:hypothetical protein
MPYDSHVKSGLFSLCSNVPTILIERTDFVNLFDDI